MDGSGKSKDKEKEELKIEEDEQTQSLEQQETLKIKGSNQRHMIMQKLMRNKTEVYIFLSWHILIHKWNLPVSF